MLGAVALLALLSSVGAGFLSRLLAAAVAAGLCVSRQRTAARFA